MTDIFDNRRRGLEEEYFRRKDKESLDKLRAELSEEAGGGPVTMDCPRCDGRLHQTTFNDVTVDQCDNCHGLWLDSGEINHFIHSGSGAGRWIKAFWPGRVEE